MMTYPTRKFTINKGVYRIIHKIFVIKFYRPSRQLVDITTAIPKPLDFFYLGPFTHNTFPSHWNSGITDAVLRTLRFQQNKNSQGSWLKVFHKDARSRTRINGFMVLKQGNGSQ